MTRIGAFEHKGRFFILAAFVILLVGSFFLRSGVNITYSLSDYNEVNKHFQYLQSHRGPVRQCR